MKTKPKHHCPIDGVKINPDAATVSVSPSAFNRWPWSGLSFPCKGDLTETVRLCFDAETFDLADVEGDTLRIDPSALSALAEDCKALLTVYDCAVCPIDATKLLRGLYAGELPEGLAAAEEEGRKDGDSRAGWIEQESWGGRVADAREAKANALAFIEADGETLWQSDCLDTPGDWLIGSAFLLSHYWIDSQRFDACRDALKVLCLAETLEDLGETVEDLRRSAFVDSCADCLMQSARSAAGLDGKGESK